MKVVAFIPFWEEYESNEFRVKKISGKYLLSYTLEKLNKVDGVNDIFVYSSSDSFKRYIDGDIQYKHLLRDESLDRAEVPMEDIISSFLEQCEADVLMLIHPTSPLLKVKSIQNCLNKVKDEGCDSSFSAVRYNKFAWCENQAINYDINSNIPKINNIKPIFFEQASLYVFTAKYFRKNAHRVSARSHLSEISFLEGLEVRDEDGFELLELILNSGMYEDAAL